MRLYYLTKHRHDVIAQSAEPVPAFQLGNYRIRTLFHPAEGLAHVIHKKSSISEKQNLVAFIQPYPGKGGAGFNIYPTTYSTGDFDRDGYNIVCWSRKDGSALWYAKNPENEKTLRMTLQDNAGEIVTDTFQNGMIVQMRRMGQSWEKYTLNEQGIVINKTVHAALYIDKSIWRACYS